MDMLRNNTSRGMTRTGLLAAIGLTVVLVGAGTWFAARNGAGARRMFHKVRIPETVLLEDFQRPLDRDLTERLVAFERTGVSQFVDASFLKPYFDDVNTRRLTVEGVELRPEQFPDRQDLHQIVGDCARILGVTKPRVFIADRPGLNAYAINMADPVIVLSSSLIRVFRDPAELRFVIGHEMGHIRCRHVKWNAILHGIVDSIRNTKLLPDEVALLPFLPLFRWSREAEMSADNAGLICCQDRAAAERALVRLAINLNPETVGRINVDAFLQQRQADDLSKFSDAMLYWRQLTQEHPFIPDRIRQLREYEKARPYQHLWENL